MKKSLRIGVTALLALAGLSSCTISDMGGSSSQSSEPSARYFTCTFNNWDGAKLYSADFKEGTAAVYGGPAPSKPDTTAGGHTAHWTFSGWDKPLDVVTGPTVFTAQFASPVNVTFKNYDGSTLLDTTVNFGDTPSYDGATPSKPSETYGSFVRVWEFEGWDKAFAPIYEPTVYTATFSSPDAIKCTFKNSDGGELWTSYCALGGQIFYSGPTPGKEETRVGDVITRYTFNGWDKPLTNLQSDTVFTAQYTGSTYYVCRFLNWDGSELKQVAVAQNGTASYDGPTPRRDPVSNGEEVTEYTFSSWDRAISGRISAPTTFTATYTSKTYAGYIVTFNDADGNKLASAPVATGETAYYPGLISEAVDACYSYDANDVTMFLGWDSSLENIASTKTFTAKTKTISRKKNGEYPQTKVTDESTISALNGLTVADGQGYCTYGGERYSKVDGVWRKVEPIKWRYLRTVSEGVAELLSERILATHAYEVATSNHEDGTPASNYAKSDIRSWLNGDFLDQAFHYDQSLLQDVELTDGANATSESNGSDGSSDKTYLPSYQDAQNEAYGFSSSDKATRVAYDADGEAKFWWTRTPSTSSIVHYFHPDGGFGMTYYVTTDFFGVRPCVQLKIA